MTQEIQMEILLVAVLLMQLGGLAAVVLIDPYIRRECRKTMLVIVFLIFLLLVRDLAAHQLDLVGTMPYRRTLCAIFGYILRPVLIILYLYIVQPKGRYTGAWILAGINAAVYLTATFSGICFSIDADNVFHRGPLGYTVHIISMVLLVYTMWKTVQEYGGIRKKESAIPIAVTVLIMVSAILDSVVDYRDYPVTFVVVVAATANIFYYIWLHLQFVREHEEDLKTQQQIQIMMTQIQPHFLYNTIATFRAMCRKDPAKAAELAGKFAAYLRQNLDTLEAAGRIPFRKELGHTKLYTDIEMVRFDNIRVEYSITDDDFTVPPLTLQPIVENAIRHGVRIRDKGIVSVLSRRNGDVHEIIVQDNGTGFDPAVLEEATGKHIGISNVKERVEAMCGGTLLIDSQIGEGTKVVIRLPDGGEDEK